MGAVNGRDGRGDALPDRTDELGDLVNVAYTEERLRLGRRWWKLEVGELIAVSDRVVAELVSFEHEVPLGPMDLDPGSAQVVHDRCPVRGHERRERAGLELERERRRVLVVELRAHERLRPGLDGDGRTREPQQQVEEVNRLRREDAAGRAPATSAPGRAAVVVPRQRTRMDNTGHQDATDRIFADRALHAHVVRREPMIHHHSEVEAALIERVHHLDGLRQIDRERLLAEDVLPGLCRRERRVPVQIVGQADRNRVDVVAREQLEVVLVNVW